MKTCWLGTGPGENGPPRSHDDGLVCSLPVTWRRIHAAPPRAPSSRVGPSGWVSTGILLLRLGGEKPPPLFPGWKSPSQCHWLGLVFPLQDFYFFFWSHTTVFPPSFLKRKKSPPLLVRFGQPKKERGGGGGLATGWWSWVVLPLAYLSFVLSFLSLFLVGYHFHPKDCPKI